MLERLALLDMDGTLFDYEKALREQLALIRSPGEPDPLDPNVDIHSENPESMYLVHRCHLIKSIPGFWRNLPKFKLGWDVYDVLKKHEFDCHVLTKGPARLPQAWQEKAECIQRHFQGKVGIDIVGNCYVNGERNEERSKGRSYGQILVDDYPKYVFGWLEHRPRGLVIMPAHSYNEKFKHDNVIRYDGSNIEEVERAIIAVKKRQPKQHWKECLEYI